MIFSSQLGKLDGYTSEEAVRAIANHLRKIQEEMEYRLSVLDSTNVSEIDTNITKITGPLIELVAENEKAVAQLVITGNEIRSEVAKELEGIHSSISQTASSIRSEVESEIYNVNSSIEQLASAIRAEVESELLGVTSRFEVSIGQIEGRVEDAERSLSHMLKLDSTGVYIVDQNGRQVTISGGQISAEGLKVNAANIIGTLTIGQLPSNVAKTSDIPTSTSQLTNNSGFTSLSSVASYVSNLGYTDATGVVSIINGTVDADFINALGVTARYLSGDVITVNYDASTYAIMYAGRNSVDTTAFELYGTNGLRLTAGGNIFLESSGGQQLVLGNDICQLSGGPLCIGADSYGSLADRPSSGTWGQLYFVVE